MWKKIGILAVVAGLLVVSGGVASAVFFGETCNTILAEWDGDPGSTPELWCSGDCNGPPSITCIQTEVFAGGTTLLYCGCGGDNNENVLCQFLLTSSDGGVSWSVECTAFDCDGVCNPAVEPGPPLWVFSCPCVN